ncbi:MAG: class C sortase [Stomatobaculum sp.]|nr:class C sortase [Stomatobaculum sp.]
MAKRGNFFLLLALLLGIFFLAYPSAADYWNSFHQYRAIREYSDQVSRMTTDEYRSYIEAAHVYNRKLSRKGIVWESGEEDLTEYESILNFTDSGSMGYIDIPKIQIKLPIYHGISDEVLQKSIGHLPETSLPVGGKGSHCVLSGHRGLPSAKLFSDLDKIVEGDVFTLSILNETYSYEVDRIRVVEPADLSELKIYPEEDLCTLVTCTPYGVNSHRLLVRGHRVANAQGDALVVADALQLEAAFVAPFIMAPMILFLLILLFVQPGKK